MLSAEAIKEFKKIYFEEYGEEISTEEAAKQANALLRLYKAIYRPSSG